MKKLKVETIVKGNTYKSEAVPYIASEEAEQIASCTRHIRKMLNEDGLGNVIPDYKIEKNNGK